MNFFTSLLSKIRQKLSNPFVRNLGWLGIAEVVYRAFRLILLVLTARFLTKYDYGLAAIVLAVREFTLTFCDIGIGAKIIQADEKELDELCNSAYWLNWAVFFGLFIAQILASFPIAWFYKNNDVILPICVSSIAYLIWPISGIQKTLIQRENRFKSIAVVESFQNIVGSIISGILAVLGMGVWAFVLSGVLLAPVEVVMFYKQHPWRPTSKFTTKYWKEIFDFGKNILGVTLLRTLRNNLDYLIVGRFLGIEELGKYFFGFNAGFGVSLSIINSINHAILPHLCSVLPDRSKFKITYFSSLKTISFVIVPLVLTQSSLAPFYVPIVFGEKWISAIPILILICLSAIPRAFADAASQLLVAAGKPHLNLRWNVIFTFIFAAALFLGVQFQAIGVAASVFLIHIICMPLFIFWTTRYVFPKKESFNLGS
ncbi:MAG: lipopolysaccharide biosynthesis protein [Nostocaceae cyanobacterium]|nr:lipopolysaccharide biosynthesis protein [Nostocaceae cyanobacterium]